MRFKFQVLTPTTNDSCSERRVMCASFRPGKLACVAEAQSSERRLIFNRTITLKDAWAKEVKKG